MSQDKEVQMSVLSRRLFLLAGSAVVAPKLAMPVHAASTEPADTFPTQDPALVREMVAVAHGNVKRVKELVDRQQTLAKATWDWGFGDWESALGAASHVGNREIAEYVIANGARPSIFSATMLGHLDVVKAFIDASPGVQRIYGPHGITLLAHARAGGDQAKPVLDYLQKLGDADPRLDSPALTDAEAAALAGTYAYGSAPSAVVTIDATKGQLGFLRINGTKRGLSQRAPREFSPAGAPNVRITFLVENGKATALTVHDPDLVLTARRVTD
ncbi:MAG: hypothetical protein AUH43_06175 [Acidobacteria bacterium 13_1_40CM_65_14]|nr:MAG: hypothetical protein AUH43_06175 [Acidobacteria bacterium 13_1_40CM_65_14]OLE78151.1 MAG: hypothetical protein AUF76_19920 [Acidobacteria bacterium 13_1_20CM_2_65_9]